MTAAGGYVRSVPSCRALALDLYHKMSNTYQYVVPHFIAARQWGVAGGDLHHLWLAWASMDSPRTNLGQPPECLWAFRKLSPDR